MDCSHLALAGLHVRTGNLHGEHLPVHKISQAYPGAPTKRSGPRDELRLSGGDTRYTDGMRFPLIFLCLACLGRAGDSQLEEKFRSIPNPQNLREYMQRLSARPHHVGSPYDKDNAEWIAAKLKGWGLDAQIENFDVLFPTPNQRLVEMLEPVKFTAKLEESRGCRRPDVKSERRAAPPVSCLFDRRRGDRPTGLRELRCPRRLRRARAHGRFSKRRDRDRPLWRILARD